jgi:hypothetical protein
MEDLLTQRINYASINVFKNYCPLENRKEYISDPTHEIHEYFTQPAIVRNTNPNKIRSIYLHYPKNKKRTKYFYSDNPNGENIYLFALTKNTPVKEFISIHESSTFITDKERQIKRHFGDPFSSINLTTIERSIRRHGDKVTFKLYVQNKMRDVNEIYFKKSFKVISLTVNLVKGDFTITNIQNGRNVKQKRFRVNSFIELEQMIKNNNTPFNMVNYTDRGIVQEKLDIKKVFDDKIFYKVVSDVFNVPNITKGNIFDNLQKFFVETKKIKVPDNYQHLLVSHYPTEKYLKKNDRKLITSILDFYGIKSKVLNKLLHKYTQINIPALVRLCYLFGDNFQKYIGNINPDAFINLNTHDTWSVTSIMFKSNYIQFKNHNYIISDEEKDNMSKIIMGGRKKLINRDTHLHIDEDFITLLSDHFNMLQKIREYDPQIKMRATDYTTFHDEHQELAKMVAAINKGWVIEYKFNEQMLGDVQKPVDLKIELDNCTYGEITFYPVILKREEEYIEEGNFMHHCVATYADKDKSIIISIRTEDKSDRITCEIDCQTGQCIQARHFCNKPAPADMELALNAILIKTKKYARLGMLHNIEKRKVPVMINGIEVYKEIVPTLQEHLFDL